MGRRVIVTGGTGFIGRLLCRRLAERGYEVVVLSRDSEKAERIFEGAVVGVSWDAKSDAGWSEHADGAYGIVNLAGANIASGRWTNKRRERILRSRLDAAKAVSEAVAHSGVKPRVVVQASAIGYYGDRGDEQLDEFSTKGAGFLSDVAERWERSTESVESFGVRRVIIRTAVVLGRHGGFLERVLPAFRFHAGGPLGSGRQWISWIHIEDEVNAICFLLEGGSLRGVFNLAAPAPVRNGGFYRTLGLQLDRPARLRMPGLALKLMLGKMADEMILAGQRVHPRRLLEAGYEFRYPVLAGALEELLGT